MKKAYYSDKEISDITNKIRALKQKGLSYRQISDQLNKEGIKTKEGKRWSPIYAYHFVYYRVPGNEKNTKRDKTALPKPKQSAAANSGTLADKIRPILKDMKLPAEAKLKIIEAYLEIYT